MDKEIKDADLTSYNLTLVWVGWYWYDFTWVRVGKIQLDI